jgi:acylphosphatase
MKRISLRISGKVQGVFYRQSSMEKAEELGITGFAMNKDDGTVYIEAQGNDEDLQKFISWCESGPSRARVDTVFVNDMDLKDEKKFEIRRG